MKNIKMSEIRILFTGVGRRIELIQAFRQAALKLDISLKIFGTDMSGTAPALVFCDFTRKVCSMSDPQYISQLLDVCRADRIDLLVPTIDTDLLILSQNYSAFEEIGVRVLISKLDKVLICRDKNNTGFFFESCGLNAPSTFNDYTKYHGPYPCFIKPKDGSSSINAYKVEDEKKLALYAKKIGDYIIQPFISGREYTIDIFCDFDGNPIFITPRERLQIRGGEVLKTCICLDEVMISEAERLCEVFRPCGPMTVQLIREEKSGIDYYIEINPRYGGGSPLSMKAGARSIEALLRLLCGEKVERQKDGIDDGAVYSRFDQSVCINAGNNATKVRGVIFDLDDTLYSEKQYILSGYRKIGEYLRRSDAIDRMWHFFENGKQAIDCYLEEIGEKEQREKCLLIYREQMPDISLYDGVCALIKNLKSHGIRVGIITDGRPLGQRKKIEALGLDKLIEDIIITDELGGIQFRKPCDIAFRILQNRWRVSYEEMIYVGDNPGKDFQACRQLGMRCVYFRNDDGLYSYDDIDGIRIINKITELEGEYKW